MLPHPDPLQRNSSVGPLRLPIPFTLYFLTAYLSYQTSKSRPLPDKLLIRTSHASLPIFTCLSKYSTCGVSAREIGCSVSFECDKSSEMFGSVCCWGLSAILLACCPPRCRLIAAWLYCTEKRGVHVCQCRQDVKPKSGIHNMCESILCRSIARESFRCAFGVADERQSKYNER